MLGVRGQIYATFDIKKVEKVSSVIGAIRGKIRFLTCINSVPYAVGAIRGKIRFLVCINPKKKMLY